MQTVSNGTPHRKCSIPVVTTDDVVQALGTNHPDYAAGVEAGRAWAEAQETFANLDKLQAAAGSPFAVLPGFLRGFVNGASATVDG
jgi:hypothetical protein